MGTHDAVAKGLARKDAERAATALLKLSPEERTGLLPAVAALVRGDIAAAHGRGDWSRLGFWAARADREPRLLGDGGAQAAEARWPLVWAAGRGKDFPRALRLWQPLHSELRERGPVLAGAVDAWLLSEGRPGPEALAGVPRAPPPDQRLGYEPVRKRAPIARPDCVAAVEQAVLACCALEPWPVFAETARGWVERSSPEVGLAVRVLAGRLAVREQLRRTAACGRGPSAPAVLLAALAKPPEALAALATEVLVSFRLLASAGRGRPFESEEEARPFCALAEVAFGLPAQRLLVTEAVVGRLFGAGAARAGLRLLERILAASNQPALALKALRLWSLARSEGPAAPAWLAQAWRRLAGGEPGALTALLARQEPKEARETLQLASDSLPLDLGEAVIDALWAGATPELRHQLAEMVRALVARSWVESEGRRVLRQHGS
ncbi:MAG: DUF6109 family natural product biosynthesis protein, partial [Myxococcaceae bacterium]